MIFDGLGDSFSEDHTYHVDDPDRFVLYEQYVSINTPTQPSLHL